MAAHQYHNVYGAFPPAALYSETLAPDQRLSWLVLVVPFMEATDLWAKTDKQMPWDAEPNRHLVETRFATYLCPAERNPGRNGAPAMTHYIGLAGLGADAAHLPLKDSKAGFFGYERRLRLSDITDGANKTLMVLETNTDIGPWAAGGDSTVRGLDTEGLSYIAVDGQFGRKHRVDRYFPTTQVGANAGFADGSVRFLPATISPRTVEALATIAGQDQPGEDF